VKAERPRVTLLVTRLNVGGAARQIRLLHGRLAERGFEPFVVSGREGAREGRLAVDGPNAAVVPSLVREMRPLDDLRAFRSIAHLLREQRPSVVHTHLAKAGTLGRLAAHRSGSPILVHTFHGHVLRGYFSPAVSRAYLEVERRLASLTDALVAVSHHVRDELLELGIGTPERWRVIPLGIELETYTDTGSEAPAGALFDLPTSGPLIGIVGRLVPIKDPDTFLRAAARIAASHSDARFVVAGDGELRPALEARARSLLGGRVRFLGWVEDLPALYAALDVVVLTSRNEGTPVSLIEAGAAGRPVVATRVGGVSEVVHDGVTGWLVPQGDDRALAARVAGLLDRPEEAAAFGEAAKALVAERFSAARTVEAHAELYRELLERRR
jgi:glycosyltransferase involved in cell wall biosynthesis